MYTLFDGEAIVLPSSKDGAYPGGAPYKGSTQRSPHVLDKRWSDFKWPALQLTLTLNGTAHSEIVTDYGGHHWKGITIFNATEDIFVEKNMFQKTKCTVQSLNQ